MNFVNYERLYHLYRVVLLFRFSSVVVIAAAGRVKVFGHRDPLYPRAPLDPSRSTVLAIY